MDLGECSKSNAPEIISIPEGVKEIEGFKGCTSLESVVIPDSVTKIGYEAFDGCTSLSSVVIPDSVTNIGMHGFKGCTSLSSVIIPDSVKHIGIAAFRGCSSLGSVIIPDPVERISASAFRDCSSLESVIIPDSVTSIDNYAFAGCASLSSVIIPGSVTSIGLGAFAGCTSLSSVIIPDSVTSIGDCAFAECTSLESVVIPDSVTSIGFAAFSECTNLSGISLPTGLEETYFCSFYGCTSLRLVFLPATLKTMSSFDTDSLFYDYSPPISIIHSLTRSSFEECPNLKYVIYHPAIEKLVLEAFPATAKRDLVFIPLEREGFKLPSADVSEFVSFVEDSICQSRKADGSSAVEVAIEKARQDVAIDATASKTDAVENDLVGFFKLALHAEIDARIAAEHFVRMQEAIAIADKFRDVFCDLSSQSTKSLRQELDGLGTSAGKRAFLNRCGILASEPIKPSVPTRRAIAKPPRPERPVEPVYEKPGLFNKKAVIQRNELARQDYERKFTAYLLLMERYRIETQRLESEQEAEYAKACREYEEKERRYKESMPEFEMRCNKAIEERRRELERAISDGSSSENSIASVISVYVEEEQTAKEALLNALSHLEFIYSCDIIFPKYRTLPAVATMCEYLETGRCTELAGPNGAYNLFESEVRADRVIAQLDMIQESLNVIKNNQYRLYEAVEDIRKSTDQLNTSLSSKLQDILSNTSDIKMGLGSIVEDVSSIKQNSAASAYFAKRIADLASKEKMFFGFTI